MYKRQTIYQRNKIWHLITIDLNILQKKELRVAKIETYFQNDIDYWMSPDYSYLVDNALIYSILPSKVVDNSSSSNTLISNYNKTVIEKLISQTKIDDNPIIMLCHLK